MAIPSSGDITAASRSLQFSNKMTTFEGFELIFNPGIGFTTAKINELGMALESFKEPLDKSVVEVMRPSIRQNFRSGGRPKWKKLEPGTIKNRLYQGTGTAILMATRTMFDSAADESNWTISDKNAVYTGDTLDAASPYAKYHQRGTGPRKSKKSGKPISKSAQKILDDIRKKGGEGGMKKRPFLMIQEKDKIQIQAIFNKWLKKQVKLHWAD